jgi:hypothetical protein
MSRLFRNIIHMSTIHKAQIECPGTEVRVRVQDLSNVHQVLTVESGHPIYRPMSIYRQQEQAILLADESGGPDAPEQITHVRPEKLQAVVKDLIVKHYEKRVSAISEIFSINWYGQEMTVIEISFGQASAP